jgi:hypothetical protein
MKTFLGVGWFCVATRLEVVLQGMMFSKKMILYVWYTIVQHYSSFKRGGGEEHFILYNKVNSKRNYLTTNFLIEKRYKIDAYVTHIQLIICFK